RPTARPEPAGQTARWPIFGEPGSCVGARPGHTRRVLRTRPGPLPRSSARFTLRPHRPMIGGLTHRVEGTRPGPRQPGQVSAPPRASRRTRRATTTAPHDTGPRAMLGTKTLRRRLHAAHPGTPL